MALYSELPIYKHGCDLLALAVDVQTQMPRMFKRSLGDKIHTMCVDILEAMASANAMRGQDRVQPVDRGIDFVGQVIKPWRRTVRKRTVASAIHRLRTMPLPDAYAAGNSYLGLMGQATHGHTDRARVAKALLRRGFTVRVDLGKVYRQRTTPTATHQ